ncbi:MAG: carbohydrate ABC transporter permease [Gammaproteobacteria bacterium]|nr:carbohydrate ABC transporter permease [Gammaproteobacteria bacterium]
MKRKLEVSELIFKIFAYTFLTIFALLCLYPFLYTISGAISGREYVDNNQIILIPKGIQFEAFKIVFKDNQFWSAYANTLFLTFFGTIFSMFVAILGAYALSKTRLLFRKEFNFFLVFTMWFSAGVVPQFLNYTATQNIFYSIGISDDKWLVVIAMGMAAMNIILLRNAFEGVPKEIEEAAFVDGANELQVLTKVYLPMSKSALATVGLFFGISRWNGYYWARTMIKNINEWPIQVYIRDFLENTIWNTDISDISVNVYSQNSLMYAMVICAIIPILIIYPYIQKYFAKGANLGGVKE